MPGKGRRPVRPELKGACQMAHEQSSGVEEQGPNQRGVSVDAGSWGRMSTPAFSGGLELSMNQLKVTVLSASCTPKYKPSKRVNAHTF